MSDKGKTRDRQAECDYRRSWREQKRLAEAAAAEWLALLPVWALGPRLAEPPPGAGRVHTLEDDA